MIETKNLEKILNQLFYEYYSNDFCYNGLQIRGKECINKMLFAVSLNSFVADYAEENNFDCIIVHHGLFRKMYFQYDNNLKNKTEKLIKNDINLFGFHKPLDFHEEISHPKAIIEDIGLDFDYSLGATFFARNSKKHTLDYIVKVLSNKISSVKFEDKIISKDFNHEYNNGVHIIKNGKEIPEYLAIESGGGADDFEFAIEKGIDTFITGEMKEQTPALSYEFKKNFVNIGHYNSEKYGILRLKEYIEDKIKIETDFLDIPNII